MATCKLQMTIFVILHNELEAMALVRALNKMTKAGMPESVRIA
ncbi:hypothetical protein QUF37_17030 [Escherichia coli]|nr:hypothetical protein [Escherichia coli]WKU30474.1 hypothetical protein QUF37_17030 [Escherichia coli]